MEYETLMMADLISMSAIVYWQCLGYKFWKMIYASVVTVITHYNKVFLTLTIVTTKFVGTIFIPPSLLFTIVYALYMLFTIVYAWQP